MTKTQLQMSDLYDRLADIGFPKRYIKKQILPDWWTDEVDATSGVLTEGALYISRRLNLDMRSLLGVDGKPVFEPRFKLKVGTNKEQLLIPCALSARIAETISYACLQPYQAIDELSVSAIRQQILTKQKVVDLEGVLDFCWQIGIPVIHFSEFPSGVHKFHGMVAYFYNRPVILVSLKDISQARLLLIIAHELGHILKGHIDRDGILVDDSDESEANQIAAELLLGRSGISYDLLQNALKILEPDANAPQQINRYLAKNLDWEKLGEENQDYLTTMLGLTFEAVGESLG
jgi:Zn-dependent peptidase ImmA (M78 family)